MKTQCEASSMTLKRFALELSVGETDKIIPQFENITGDAPSVTFLSADSDIVEVSADGALTAKKVGKTTVTVACAATGDTARLPVGVIAKEHDYRDQIMLSTFWPPNPESMLNDEQWQLMSDAGINSVLGEGAGMGTPENQVKMLKLCDKYGMGLTVGTGFGFFSNEELPEKLSYYKNVPAAYGYYLIDEPPSANGFVDRYCAIKKSHPSAYVHLNFLPEHYYGDGQIYRGVLNDYAALIADRGCQLDYLMFDMYPFPDTGDMNKRVYFSNLRAVAEVARTHGAAPAAYIQTVRSPNAFRRPSASELRYQMYASLAFGCKQLSFFTWFTPESQNESFVDGIMTTDGKPNQHYAYIKEINREILAIGKTLAKCDVLSVYFDGAESPLYEQPSIPAGFFVQVAEGRCIVSHLRHTESGRNYLMVVNDNYDEPQEVKLVLDERVTSLSEVSRVDGSLLPLGMNGHTITLSLAAGDAIFMALPEGVDFYEAPAGQPDELTNLAADSVVYASSSRGADGWFIYNLTDGKRVTTGIKGKNYAWASAGDPAPYVKMDFGCAMSFNRVDLYAAGNFLSYGAGFPKALTISVSDDGADWRQVKTFADIPFDAVKATGVQLDFEGQTARWIRLDFTEFDGYVALNQIEVYNDAGHVPAPETVELLPVGGVVTYTEGENIAAFKDAFCSSSTPDSIYQPIGWCLANVNDNRGASCGQGFTTNVGRNYTPDAVEFVGIDLGDVFTVEKVVISPMGHQPIDYDIQLSNDGCNWTTVYEVRGAEPASEDIVLEIQGAKSGRFVRLYATKLRGGGGDGYLLQLAELYVYGTPVCDKTELEAAVAGYIAMGGDQTAELYTGAMADLARNTLTQGEANRRVAELKAAV